MMSWQEIVQILYPTLCIGCAHVIPKSLVVCEACLSTITPIPSIRLPVHDNIFLSVYACAPYIPPIKRLITSKFSHNPSPTYYLAQLMHMLMPREHLQADLFVPIPLHWRRYAHRGFNQAYVLAQTLGHLTNTSVHQLLRRTRATEYQSKLKKIERHSNIIDAFAPAWWYHTSMEKIIQGKTIALVDDLCTTGNTLVHAAKIIARYQPQAIKAIVACRAV